MIDFFPINTPLLKDTDLPDSKQCDIDRSVVRCALKAMMWAVHFRWQVIKIITCVEKKPSLKNDKSVGSAEPNAMTKERGQLILVELYH